MAITYDKIATTTLSSATNTITFNSIPGTYTDLRLVFVPKFSSSGEVGYMRLNSDSGNNYSSINLVGAGSYSFSNTSGGSEPQIAITEDQVAGSSSTLPQFNITDILSYTGSNFKTILNVASNDQNGSGGLIYKSGLYRSTSAITRIDILTLSAGNFAIGSTATLYGILKA